MPAVAQSKSFTSPDEFKKELIQALEERKIANEKVSNLMQAYNTSVAELAKVGDNVADIPIDLIEASQPVDDFAPYRQKQTVGPTVLPAQTKASDTFSFNFGWVSKMLSAAGAVWTWAVRIVLALLLLGAILLGLFVYDTIKGAKKANADHAAPAVEQSVVEAKDYVIERQKNLIAKQQAAIMATRSVADHAEEADVPVTTEPEILPADLTVPDLAATLNTTTVNCANGKCVSQTKGYYGVFGKGKK